MTFYAAKSENLVVKNRPAQVTALEQEGIDALNSGDSAQALSTFEAAERIFPDPSIRSFLAYCLAAERQDYRRAMSMAISALREDPRNPVQYLNLGRIQILCGKKRDAVRMFLRGQSYEGRAKKSIFHDDLVKLGVRKNPPISFLARSNPFNKYLGLMLSRLRLR